MENVPDTNFFDTLDSSYHCEAFSRHYSCLCRHFMLLKCNLKIFHDNTTRLKKNLSHYIATLEGLFEDINKKPDAC